jgi:hypothetical protein
MDWEDTGDHPHFNPLSRLGVGVSRPPIPIQALSFATRPTPGFDVEHSAAGLSEFAFSELFFVCPSPATASGSAILLSLQTGQWHCTPVKIQCKKIMVIRSV